MLKKIFIPMDFAFCCLLFFSCGSHSDNYAQNSSGHQEKSGKIGGPCEICDRLYLGLPNEIDDVNTSSGWDDLPVKMVVEGVVFQSDGVTPAPNVILYYWHTDDKGLYVHNKEPQSDKLHGYLRGWVQSNDQGKFTIYTNRPASYPGRTESEHIHVVVKEPGLDQEYYIDAWVFADDPLLTDQAKQRYNQRGGSGILNPTIEGTIHTVRPVVTLGKNIPNYPNRQ